MSEAPPKEKPDNSQRRPNQHNVRPQLGGRGRGRIGPVQKAMFNFGVPDLREILDRKHRDMEQARYNGPPDPSYCYLRDPMRDKCNFESQNYNFYQNCPEELSNQSWSRGCSPRVYRGRGRNNEKHLESGEHSFIQNPLNIKIELKTSTGERNCTIDKDTKLPDIKHCSDEVSVPNYVNVNSAKTRDGRARGRGVQRSKSFDMRSRKAEDGGFEMTNETNYIKPDRVEVGNAGSDARRSDAERRNNMAMDRGLEMRSKIDYLNADHFELGHKGIEARSGVFRGAKSRAKSETRVKERDVTDTGSDSRNRTSELRGRGSLTRASNARGRGSQSRGRPSGARGKGRQMIGSWNDIRDRESDTRGSSNDSEGRGIDSRCRGIDSKRGRGNVSRGRGSNSRGKENNTRGQGFDSEDTRSNTMVRVTDTRSRGGHLRGRGKGFRRGHSRFQQRNFSEYKEPIIGYTTTDVFSDENWDDSFTYNPTSSVPNKEDSVGASLPEKITYENVKQNAVTENTDFIDYEDSTENSSKNITQESLVKKDENLVITSSVQNENRKRTVRFDIIENKDDIGVNEDSSVEKITVQYQI